jgi:hypothetical protein
MSGTPAWVREDAMCNGATLGNTIGPSMSANRTRLLIR